MSLTTDNPSKDALLEVLKDPEAFKTKIEELERAEENLQKIVQLAGPAEDIPRLHEAAANAKTEASKALSDAREEANTIVREADDLAGDTVAEADAKATEILAKAKGQADDAASRIVEAQKAEAVLLQHSESLGQQNETLASWKDDLDTESADLEKRETQLLQEKSKLATVRETIAQFLG